MRDLIAISRIEPLAATRDLSFGDALSSPLRGARASIAGHARPRDRLSIKNEETRVHRRVTQDRAYPGCLCGQTRLAFLVSNVSGFEEDAENRRAFSRRDMLNEMLNKVQGALTIPLQPLLIFDFAILRFRRMLDRNAENR